MVVNVFDGIQLSSIIYLKASPLPPAPLAVAVFLLSGLLALSICCSVWWLAVLMLF